jgi:hypothetical protein
MKNVTVPLGSFGSTCYGSQQPKPVEPVRPTHANSVRRVHSHCVGCSGTAARWRERRRLAGGREVADDGLHQLQGSTTIPLHQNLREEHRRGELHREAVAHRRGRGVRGR